MERNELLEHLRGAHGFASYEDPDQMGDDTWDLDDREWWDDATLARLHEEEHGDGHPEGLGLDKHDHVRDTR